MSSNRKSFKFEKLVCVDVKGNSFLKLHETYYCLVSNDDNSVLVQPVKIDKEQGLGITGSSKENFVTIAEYKEMLIQKRFSKK